MLYIIAAVGAALFLLERIVPDQKLPRVAGWWTRVVVVNLIQLGVVIVGGLTWDLYFQRYSLFALRDQLHPALAGGVAYLLSTFVYYWWHRARHDVQFLWLAAHQVHHSPRRIETITSFYKHPLEITVNSLLTGAICYVLLGAGVEGAAFNMLYSALGEFFYHMNIRTPRWVGYFFQRPEMHRIHHQAGVHYNNFADLPIWDMLFGTYRNPRESNDDCGFIEERERRLWGMLAFQDVNRPEAGLTRARLRTALAVGLILLGFMQMVGFLTGVRALRGIGAASVASPLPLVFTEVRGWETFASRFTVEYETAAGRGEIEITPAVYRRLRGPYNWRNVYGAALAYGPVLPEAMSQAVLTQGFCRSPLPGSFGIAAPIRRARVRIATKTRGRDDVHTIAVECPADLKRPGPRRGPRSARRPGPAAGGGPQANDSQEEHA